MDQVQPLVAANQPQLPAAHQEESRIPGWLRESAMLAAGVAFTYFMVKDMSRTDNHSAIIEMTSAGVMNYVGIRVAGFNGLMVSNIVQSAYLGMQFGRENHNALMWLTDWPVMSSAIAAAAMTAHVWSDGKLTCRDNRQLDRYGVMWLTASVISAAAAYEFSEHIPANSDLRWRMILCSLAPVLSNMFTIFTFMGAGIPYVLDIKCCQRRRPAAA